MYTSVKLVYKNFEMYMYGYYGHTAFLQLMNDVKNKVFKFNNRELLSVFPDLI